MKRFSLLLLAAGALLARSGLAGPAVPESKVEALYAELEPVYFDLHRHPELSLHETRTAFANSAST